MWILLLLSYLIVFPHPHLTRKKKKKKKKKRYSIHKQHTYHGEHTELPAIEKLPAAHCAQSTPVMVKYPAGQDVHFEEPGLDTAPECVDKVC